MSGSRSVRIEILGSAKGAQAAFADVGASADGLGSKLGTLGKLALAASAGLVTAAAGFAVDGLNQFRQFESGLNEVFTLIPQAGQETFDSLTQGVKDFSREFGVLPDKVIPSLYQALSAGVPSDNVFAFLEVAQKAAKGGVTELETAVDGISSVINAYGTDVLSATKASDLMFTAVRLGKTDFNQLSNSLFNVIPTAASLGVGFEDITAALARLTAQGTPTSVATTQLRAALVEAAQGGSELDTALKELHGKSFPDLVAGGMNIGEIFESLRSSMPENEFRDLFGSVEGLNAVLGITGPNAEAFRDTLDEMGDSAGATDDAFAQMDTGIQPVLDRLRAALSVARIELGEKLAPYAERFLTFVLETGVPALQTFADTISGPLFSGLKTAAGFITETVIPAVSSLADFAGRVKDAFDEDGLGGALGEFASGLLSLFESVDWDGIADTVVTKLGEALSGLGSLAWDAGAWLIGIFRDIEWSDVADEVLAGLSDALSFGGSAVWDAGAWLIGVFQGVSWSDVAGEVLAGLGDALSTAASTAWDAAQWVIDAVSEVDWSEAATTIKDGLLGAVFAIADWGEQFYDWISGVVTETDWSGIGTSIRDGVLAAWFAVADWGERFVGWVDESIIGADWSGIGTSIRDGVTGALDKVDWSGLGTSISTAFSGLVDSNATIATFIERLNGIVQSAQPVIDIIKTSLLNSLDSLKETWDGVAESFEGVEWGPILEALQTLGTVLGIVFGAVVLTAIVSTVKALEGFLTVLSVVLPPAVSGAVLIIEGMATTINLLRDTFSNVVSVIRSLVDGDWSTAWSSAKTMVSEFTDGVTGLLNDLMTGATGIIDDLTGGTLTSISTWVTNMRTQVIQLYTDFIEWIGAAATDSYSKISGFVTDALSSLSGFVTDAVTELGTLPGRAVDAVGDLSSLLYDIGRDLLQGLIDGIRSMFGPLEDTLGWVTDRIPDWKGPLERDRGLLFGTGQAIIGGLIGGMESRYGDVERSLSGLTASIPGSGGMVGADTRGTQSYGAGSSDGGGRAASPPITINNTFNVEDRSPAAIANAVTMAELKMGQQLQKELVGV